ncbi:MAG: PAS domain-containing protein [Geitlerinemataceae cyanobacterium]
MHLSSNTLRTETDFDRSRDFSSVFLTNLLNTIADPIVVKDARHQWILCNDAFCDLIGHNRSKMLGKSDRDFLPKAKADEIWEKDEQVLVTGIAEISEDILTDAEGHIREIATHRDRFFDELNHPFLIRRMRNKDRCQNIESRLNQPQNVLQQIIDSLPKSIFWKDRSLKYLGCNRNFARDAGLDSPNEIVGKTDYDLPWTREEADFYRECDSQVMDANQPQLHIIETLHQADGTQLWIDTSKVPLHDAAGNAIGILGIYQDITEQKEAEIALKILNENLENQVKQRTEILRDTVNKLQKEIQDRKKVEAELQEQEQFLRTVYNGVEHLIFTIDVSDSGEFRYAGWNEPTARATGVSNADVTGKTPKEVFGEVEGKKIDRKYNQCLNTGVPIHYEEKLIFDGQETWWMTTITPLRSRRNSIEISSSEKIDRLIGTTFNITARKQAEDQLDRKKKDLEYTLLELQKTQRQLIQSEKMSSLGQLVAGIAHEINNPVSFIYGNLTHVKDYTQDLLGLLDVYQECYPMFSQKIQEKNESIDLGFLREDLPKTLESMKTGAERIKKIVLSLRNFSRMDESGLKWVNLHEGIDSTLMILKNRLRKQGNRAEIEVVVEGGDLPNIQCYAGQLNQVFMNILTNAIDAIEDSFVIEHRSLDLCIGKKMKNPGRILISTTVLDNNRVSIRISDNGLGMTETVRQRIFDPFFTTKPIGKGTGMGLSICYQIVTDSHGGTLECISQVGRGTEFVIQLPQRQL